MSTTSTNTSVSKGVFVFKNGIKTASKKSRKHKKDSQSPYSNHLWYQTYKALWNKLEIKLQEVNNEMFSSVLSGLIEYLKTSYNGQVSEVPAAALLTGINMPDYSALFKTLKNKANQEITPHVCFLNGEDCQSLKQLFETMINQLVKKEDDYLEEDEEDSTVEKVKKSQCNFSFLHSWYEDMYILPKSNKSPKKQKLNNHSIDKKIILVIIPEFENFPPKVLQDLILIAGSYINVVPFVFVFGVATSLSVVHRSLPCHVSSQIKIQVFHSSSSTTYLNNVLENILLSPDCPFQLGGKVFNLFTDIFLFYDLSVSGFIQNFKYAMIEHFSFGNAMALCQQKHVKQILQKFTKEDVENVRQIYSFRKYVEEREPEVRIKLLTDDEYLKTVVRMEVKQIIEYLPHMHLFLRCLHVLVCDLPNAPLGKQVRELYAIAVSKNITATQEYKQCLQLLSFQSREELSKKMLKIRDLIDTTVGHSNSNKDVKDVVSTLDGYVRKLNSWETLEESPEKDGKNNLADLMDRMQLKEKLIQMSQQSKPKNKYEKLKEKALSFVSFLLGEFLLEPTSFCFHEIFFFNDSSIQTRIIGSHRAAIHTALNDSHFYLQCPCCEISNDAIILPTMPDLSIVYKLHLECGKMINLYDWLQSFLSIVDPQDLEDDEKPRVQPELQARFTQAVAELEYLGFIKSSKRKTDHVARLTWGG